MVASSNNLVELADTAIMMNTSSSAFFGGFADTIDDCETTRFFPIRRSRSIGGNLKDIVLETVSSATPYAASASASSKITASAPSSSLFQTTYTSACNNKRPASTVTPTTTTYTVTTIGPASTTSIDRALQRPRPKPRRQKMASIGVEAMRMMPDSSSSLSSSLSSSPLSEAPMMPDISINNKKQEHNHPHYQEKHDHGVHLLIGRRLRQIKRRLFLELSSGQGDGATGTKHPWSTSISSLPDSTSSSSSSSPNSSFLDLQHKNAFDDEEAQEEPIEVMTTAVATTTTTTTKTTTTKTIALLLPRVTAFSDNSSNDKETSSPPPRPPQPHQETQMLSAVIATVSEDNDLDWGIFISFSDGEDS
jgi:hypothetical protein